MRRLALLLALLLAAPAAAQIADDPARPLGAAQWLQQNTRRGDGLFDRPAQRLAAEAAGGQPSWWARLGELAFRSPQILGGLARRSGLSCDTCHSSGHVNAGFFVPQLSDRPGNVDVSDVVFSALAEDGIDNPINIPTLRGVATTAPYGHDGRIADLRGFVRQVIVIEFEGDEPAPWLLDGLVAYLQQLTHPPTPPADAAAGRGAALFRRAGSSGPACAACHVPDAGFADGRRHDVGSGLRDTPGLQSLADSAPYFSDGRHAGLDAVLTHFAKQHGHAWTAAERADLLAYLRQIGGRGEREPVTFAADWARLEAFAALLPLAAEAAPEPARRFVVDALRRQLEPVHQRFAGADLAAERDRLVALSRRLAAARTALEQGEAVDFAGLTAAFHATGEALAAAAGRSLYDPARLRAALAAGG
jgi:cytochrome c peroxidase